MILEEQLQVLNNYIVQFIQYMKDNNRFIVYDLETNGFVANPMPSVLSISAELCKVNPNKTISVIDTYNRFYYCKEEYNPKATKVNGLIDDEINKRRIEICGSFDDYTDYFLDDIASFKTFCGNTSVFLGFNNTGFDNIFLEDYMIFPHSLDIMVVQAALENGKYRKLKEVAPDYDVITDEAELHQSSYDVYLTKSIFSSMLSMSTVRMIELKE